MNSHNRALLFCLAILFAPVLYWAGDEVGGAVFAILLPSLAVVASFLFAKWPDRRGVPPKGPQP